MTSIRDRDFWYTSSADTDLKKSFARIRREQRRLEMAQSEVQAEALKNVVQIADRREGVGPETAVKI